MEKRNLESPIEYDVDQAVELRVLTLIEIDEHFKALLTGLLPIVYSGEKVSVPQALELYDNIKTAYAVRLKNLKFSGSGIYLSKEKTRSAFEKTLGVVCLISDLAIGVGAFVHLYVPVTIGTSVALANAVYCGKSLPEIGHWLSEHGHVLLAGVGISHYFQGEHHSDTDHAIADSFQQVAAMSLTDDKVRNSIAYYYALDSVLQHYDILKRIEPHCYEQLCLAMGNRFIIGLTKPASLFSVLDFQDEACKQTVQLTTGHNCTLNDLFYNTPIQYWKTKELRVFDTCSISMPIGRRLIITDQADLGQHPQLRLLMRTRDRLQGTGKFNALVQLEAIADRDNWSLINIDELVIADATSSQLIAKLTMAKNVLQVKEVFDVFFPENDLAIQRRNKQHRAWVISWNQSFLTVGNGIVEQLIYLSRENKLTDYDIGLDLFSRLIESLPLVSKRIAKLKKRSEKSTDKLLANAEKIFMYEQEHVCFVPERIPREVEETACQHQAKQLLYQSCILSKNGHYEPLIRWLVCGFSEFPAYQGAKMLPKDAFQHWVALCTRELNYRFLTDLIGALERWRDKNPGFFGQSAFEQDYRQLWLVASQRTPGHALLNNQLLAYFLVVHGEVFDCDDLTQQMLKVVHAQFSKRWSLDQHHRLPEDNDLIPEEKEQVPACIVRVREMLAQLEDEEFVQYKRCPLVKLINDSVRHPDFSKNDTTHPIHFLRALCKPEPSLAHWPVPKLFILQVYERLRKDQGRPNVNGVRNALSEQLFGLFQVLTTHDVCSNVNLSVAMLGAQYAIQSLCNLVEKTAQAQQQDLNQLSDHFALSFSDYSLFSNSTEKGNKRVSSLTMEKNERLFAVEGITRLQNSCAKVIENTIEGVLIKHLKGELGKILHLDQQITDYQALCAEMDWTLRKGDVFMFFRRLERVVPFLGINPENSKDIDANDIMLSCELKKQYLVLLAESCYRGLTLGVESIRQHCLSVLNNQDGIGVSTCELTDMVLTQWGSAEDQTRQQNEAYVNQ